MLLGQSLLIALDMLRVHKLRALLTMLGVIIGVMSVSLIVMVSGAFQSYLTGEFQRIGSDTIFVSYNVGRLERGESVGDVEGLKVSDIQFILDRVPDVDLASAYRSAGSQTVQAGDREAKEVMVQAVDDQFTNLNRITLLRGRQFSREDERSAANVALISETVEKELFPDRDPIGQRIRVGSLSLEVIGVTKPTELMGQRRTEALFLPLRTANLKWLGGERVDIILMRAASGKDTNAVMDQIWRALMVKVDNRPLYTVDSSQNVLAVFNRILGVIGLILAGIAALSLLVGGVGVMNIMLVSVTERTREIGLRKAVGARPLSIMAQFLVESLTLCIVGGLIGLGLAYGLSIGISALTLFLKWPNETGLAAPFPVGPSVAALGISALIGGVFGFYPAYRAARMDPIEALRAE